MVSRYYELQALQMNLVNERQILEQERAFIKKEYAALRQAREQIKMQRYMSRNSKKGIKALKQAELNNEKRYMMLQQLRVDVKLKAQVLQAEKAEFESASITFIRKLMRNDKIKRAIVKFLTAERGYKLDEAYYINGVRLKYSAIDHTTYVISKHKTAEDKAQGRKIEVVTAYNFHHLAPMIEKYGY